jgi:hypothetical protein
MQTREVQFGGVVDQQTRPVALPQQRQGPLDVRLKHGGAADFRAIGQPDHGLVIGRRLQLVRQGSPGMTHQRVGDADQALVAFLVTQVGRAKMLLTEIRQRRAGGRFHDGLL